MDNQQIITADKISIGYGTLRDKKHQTIHEDLSVILNKGEFACLIGANGSGKSTLLRTISRTQPIQKGSIKIYDKELTDYSEKELSQLMGLVLTDKTSAGGFTVRELVELGRYPYTGFFGQLNEEDRVIVEQAIKDVGISHKADSYVADLSDGERQKAMIAKALSQECPIILLDEPTAFLDVESRIEVMSLLHKLAHEGGKTILLSTHDIDLAFLLADKLWLLSKESGLTCGVTEDLILSGMIDNFFTSDNIVFNKYSGSFYPVRSNTKKVYVDAQEELLYWTINLLLRMDLDYTTKEEESFCKISVKTNREIVLQKDKAIEHFSSFEALVEKIKIL